MYILCFFVFACIYYFVLSMLVIIQTVGVSQKSSDNHKSCLKNQFTTLYGESFEIWSGFDIKFKLKANSSVRLEELFKVY